MYIAGIEELGDSSIIGAVQLFIFVLVCIHVQCAYCTCMHTIVVVVQFKKKPGFVSE